MLDWCAGNRSMFETQLHAGSWSIELGITKRYQEHQTQGYYVRLHVGIPCNCERSIELRSQLSSASQKVPFQPSQILTLDSLPQLGLWMTLSHFAFPMMPLYDSPASLCHREEGWSFPLGSVPSSSCFCPPLPAVSDNSLEPGYLCSVSWLWEGRGEASVPGTLFFKMRLYKWKDWDKGD